jgi:hypothetical protein
MNPLAEDHQWDQVVLDAQLKEHFEPGLVSLIALDHPPPRIVPIGTGFIIQAKGANALVCTAAHNFEPGIRQIQEPRPRHHPTTPREFLPEPRLLDLGALRVRALVAKNGQLESATLNWAVVDESVDLAFFSISAERPGTAPFEHQLPLSADTPSVGAEIAVLGCTCEMLSAPPHFTMKRTLWLRRGRVTDHHERFFGCDGPCVQTTIPMLPGMSGGPVFAVPEDGAPIKPFGFVSSDPDGANNTDPKTAGASIVPLITDSVVPLESGAQEVLINMRKARINPGAQSR